MGGGCPPRDGEADQVDLARSANRCCKMTASTMIAPLTNDCTEVDRLLSTKKFIRVWKISTPNAVPKVVPRPPMRSAAPTTAAAIASSSYSPPVDQEPAAVRPIIITAAIPAVSPHRVKT